MTIETRSTIDLDDITAIEYECSKCHCKTIRALDDKHRVPAVCGNCSRVWMTDGSREHQELTSFIAGLREFRRSSVNQDVRIRLEVHGIKKAEA
jgi:hypothetical protein